jgi:O-glycosyl hydrolase
LKAMVWGIALHWYSGDGFSNVQQVYDAWPGKGIMATEACDCPINLDRWQTGEHYGHDILGDLNAGTQGWTDWNLMLDWTGGSHSSTAAVSTQQRQQQPPLTPPAVSPPLCSAPITSEARAATLLSSA